MGAGMDFRPVVIWSLTFRGRDCRWGRRRSLGNEPLLAASGRGIQ